jgi:hypothetical protein
VVKQYLAENESSTGNQNQYNVFWSNVGVLKASLYANPPKPVVKREFDDYSDDAARVASIMMERLLKQGFAKPESDMTVAFTHTVEDRLVPGLGQIWVRYVPTTETVELSPAQVDSKGRVVREAITEEVITSESAITDYVYWEDFIWSPCRVWDECRWVARRVWMDKPDFKARFPKISPETVSWTKKTSTKYGERVTPETLGVEKTEIFEVWCKTDRSIYFVSKSCDKLLERTGDVLELDDFFPCPKPLLATHTTSSTVPKADYMMVQSQYQRLNNLTKRIGALEDAIQASGVYDKENKELSQLLPANGNKMIPVDNWAMFSEKNGLKGVIDWFPLDMVVDALDKLRELKQEAKAELYELTGISDIMRGITKERETAYAQGLKAQYSSVRLQYIQGEVAAFIQAGLRIKANIISKHFQPETIIRNSLIELTPDAALAEEAVKLLKDNWSSHFRIHVFADTLAIPDYNAERQGRIEFIGAAGQFISQIFPVLESKPETAPFFLQIMQWAISSFRSAQSIEGVFDKAIAAIIEQMKQPKPPPPPDPALLKIQAEVEAKQAESQINQIESAQDLRNTAIKDVMEVKAIQDKANATVAATNAKTLAQVAAIRAKANAKPSKSS